MEGEKVNYKFVVFKKNRGEEERYADLSQVDDNRYEQLIKDTDSDYVLFLNQHYLKWQEKAFAYFCFISPVILCLIRIRRK